jgi:4'-phosphopantetheinyl transferase
LTVAIVCWHVDVSELIDEGRFERAMDALAWPERREKVMRYRFGRDRRLSLAGGLLVAHALRAWGVRDLTMAYGEFGKPRLARDAGVHFNLSHAGTYCVCAVADEPVGADVEVSQEVDAGVVRICLQERERVWMYAQADTGWAFTRLWTRKEAYLKLLGTGLSLEANTFAALPEDEEALGVRFFEAELQGHALSVCRRSTQPVSLERFDLTTL